MTDNSDFDDFEQEAPWENLFEMADSYKEPDIDSEPICLKQENSINQETIFRSPEEALKVLFGYDSFRTGQKSIIDNILAGRDTLAVMPTGAGKSVCYQIPAMLLPGVTLVISPLISLMQDQVKALHEAGISAAFINSSLSENAFMKTVNMAKKGRFKLIYVAPERLVTETFIRLAKSLRISMVTVDEAHCISQWGQDFRPSYMKILGFIEELDYRPIISAFTATATENVRDDIVCSLGLIRPYLLVTGFDRENLFFQVDRPRNKDLYVLNYIRKHREDSGIIYCATRKNVERLYGLLKNNGISVVKYHAGMDAPERKQMQDDFVFDYARIVVATNAFGMGIDKSNVRFVIHYNMPQSMENYYQEAGRAGRDGLEANCILLFSTQDIVIDKFLINHKEIQDLEPVDMRTVRERDLQRLQAMYTYCYSNDCLRNYILKYFGENPIEPCGNCSNCLREFETLDMTNEAKKLINCVYEMKGKYGRNIVLDTLLGAKTARLKEIGADRYKSYGCLVTSEKNLLSRLLDELVLNDYLRIENQGEYQLVKMGNIEPLKAPDAKVMIKVGDEDKHPVRVRQEKKSVTGKESLTSAGYQLFDRLKALRLQIAREEKVPPYIVFSDKTLINMAALAPKNQQEMLKVSGVGENKYAKYGERFVKEIANCVEQNLVDDYGAEIDNQRSKEPNPIITRAKGKINPYGEQLSHIGKPWTEDEDRTLTDEYLSGQFDIPELSKSHGRTSGGIKARLRRLKLIE